MSRNTLYSISPACLHVKFVDNLSILQHIQPYDCQHSKCPPSILRCSSLALHTQNDQTITQWTVPAHQSVVQFFNPKDRMVMAILYSGSPAGLRLQQDTKPNRSTSET